MYKSIVFVFVWMICVSVLSALPNIILTGILNIELNQWAMVEVYSTSLLLIGFIVHKFLAKPKKQMPIDIDEFTKRVARLAMNYGNLLDIKSNFDGNASGIILESRIDKG